MNRHNGLLSAFTAIALVGSGPVPAVARPPTVGINPGYDRRLIESRKQQAGFDAAPVVTAPHVHKRHARHRS